MSVITGLSGLNASTAWQVLMKDPAKQLDQFAKNKDIQKDLEYFKKNIGKFKTVDDLLKDQRATRVLLSAYDLENEMAGGMGRIKKVLTENPSSDTALSARLLDRRFANMAKDLRLDESMDKLKRLTFFDNIKEKYIQNEFEEALGNIDPTLRQAAYFARNVDSADDIYGILGDKILRDVVQKTLNLPAQLAVQPVETQARAIASRLKVDQFGVAAAKNALSTSQITRAKQDASIIGNNLKISDAAMTQINAIQAKVQAAVDAYDAYAAKTFDPAEVAVQQKAIPQLLRFEQLLSAGGKAISSVTSSIEKLQALTTSAASASTPEALASLKTRFNDLVDTIATQINGATVTPPTAYDQGTSGGTPPTENIFQFGSNTVLTASLKASGTNDLNINAFNTADLTTFLNNAKASFAAITDKTDSGHIGGAVNSLISALNRGNTIKSSITVDTAKLNTKLDDPDYGVNMDSAAIIKGKRSIEDAMTRTQKIVSLLGQIGKVADDSKARAVGADRTDLETKFGNLRTELNTLIATPGAAGIDNLLTTTDSAQYSLLERPATGGGTEDIYMYAKGVKTGIDEIVTALSTASVSDKAGANALSLKAIQLTNRTDAATASLTVDKTKFDRTISNYDPKAKIDVAFFDIQRDLDTAITAAAKNGSNLLSSDQTEISFAVSTNTSVLRMRPATTFRSDMLAGLSGVIAQFGNGLTATRAAADDLNNIVDRTRRFLASDNRNLTFEQGRIGAVLDTLDADTAADGSAMYKTNSFTEKFIARYLTLNASSSPTFSSAQASSLNLFSGTASAGNILSLSLSI